MKVFYCVPPFGQKVNFVDSNNVVLGYDLSYSCCEFADCYIAGTIQICKEKNDKVEYFGEELNDAYLEDFVFDTEFYIQKDDPIYDCGGVAIFRITNGDEKKFIHLFNNQNGYYSHGFNFKINDTVIKCSSI